MQLTFNQKKKNTQQQLSGFITLLNLHQDFVFVFYELTNLKS